MKACTERDVYKNNVPHSGISVTANDRSSAAFIPRGTLFSKFKSTPVTDQVVEDGKLIWIKGLLQCITCMNEYENKSLEEIRFEDYHAAYKEEASRAEVTNSNFEVAYASKSDKKGSFRSGIPNPSESVSDVPTSS